MDDTTKYDVFGCAVKRRGRSKAAKTSFCYKLGKYIYRYKYILSAFVFLSILLSPQLSSLAQAPSNGNVNDSIETTHTETEIYYLNAVNQLRSRNGLKTLTVDSRLSISANAKALDMQNNKYWGHYAPVGKSFAEYIWANSPNAETVGENLAKCYISKQEAFEALVASPAHYAIMMGSFTNFGVSEIINKNDSCTYTVMHFSQYKR